MGCKLCTPEPEECQVLGIRWNTKHDQLIFDFGDVCERMKHANPTKRNAVSLATRFFDPLGVLSPITIRFKILFQQLCKEGLDWDEPLSGEALTRWNKLSSDLEHAQAIVLVIPRSYKSRVNDAVTSARLVGYCDASKSAYAATVYLQLKTVSCVLTEFVCSKTRVAPLKELTIPRLELLSALLLARLISTLQMALKPEVRLEEPVCNTDSQVALHWISGEAREWKQFVQNRVIEIRKLVPHSRWRHCPGTQNPADIPSRGVSVVEFKEKEQLWLHGPKGPVQYDICKFSDDPSNECLVEMKAKEKATTSLLSTKEPDLVEFERFSSLQRVTRVMAYVLRFVQALKTKTRFQEPTLRAEEIDAAMLCLLRLPRSHFPIWHFHYGAGSSNFLRTRRVSGDAKGDWPIRTCQLKLSIQSSCLRPII